MRRVGADGADPEGLGAPGGRHFCIIKHIYVQNCVFFENRLFAAGEAEIAKSAAVEVLIAAQ